MYDFDLVCIGSGPAGQRAAVQAAKLGKRVAIIERGAQVGGVSVHSGTIPSKTFREAVVSMTAGTDPFRTGGRHDGYQLPTAQELLARVGSIVRTEARVQEIQLRRNGIELYMGTARFLDPHTLHVQSATHDQEITAAKILIAVGSKPVLPPEFALDSPLVLTSDEILRLDRIPKTLAVIGCGVIGMEFASMFAALDVEVTAVDGREEALPFLDTEIVDELIHQLRNRDVTFRFGEEVERLDATSTESSRVTVNLRSGKRFSVELALIAAGRAGATDELDLAKANLEADHRGRLKVDAEFRTKVKHIMAAGDVIGFPGLAATSAEQGRRAACYAFDVQSAKTGKNDPVGIYAIPEISMVGAPEHELTKNKIPYEVGEARFREIARGQILGDDTGLLKLLFHTEDYRLLGVHIIGTGATELVHIGQAILTLGEGIDYFLDTVFNYPTLAECYKVAALDAYNKLESV